ncbi:MAG: cobalamin B12-binding domain-containing protein, partial [Lentisphaeria bacterium]|nr:cobalamin B12-binding domain-containing protein [Lentisphaeria bacterium]
MTQPLKIFLCDLVHDFIGAATYMFPLNIGYLAAYLKEEFGDAVDVRLFKFPENLLRAVDNETPAIVGFSHYVWNADLNAKVAQRVKARSPGTLMVFGGPNIDYTDFGIKRFFNAAKVADAFIPYQGETPFNHLVREYLTHDCDGGALTA